MFEERQKSLEALCEKYPIEIPLPEAAKWLGIAPESLRAAICQGTCSFPALAWRKAGKQNRAFHIPTASFYKVFKIN